MAPTQTRRLRTATTTRSANGAMISRAVCMCMSGSSENPTTKCFQSGTQPVSGSTCCRVPRAGDVSLHRTRRSPRQPIPIAFPVDVLVQGSDIGRTQGPNNSWPLPGGRSSWTAIRPDKVPDASEEVCRSLKCRLWLVPNGPTVLGPDWLPGLDGLVGDPLFAGFNGVDGECLDHREHTRCDAACNTENGT